MKKKLIYVLLTIGLLATGCESAETEKLPEITVTEEQSEITETDEPSESMVTEETTESVVTEKPAETTVTETPAEVPETEKQSLFSQFENLEFYFGSGAGAWRTVLYIENDGGFFGEYSDSDMGSVGEGYPHGTCYICTFEGRFTEPVKVNDYTYSMQIEEIRYEQKAGTEEIIDEILYCYSTPYGLDGAEEIYIYLPGAPLGELPEEYKNWVRFGIEEPDAAELSFYGIYNATEQNGFSSYPVNDPMDDLMAATEEWSITIKASLENEALSQYDMNMKSKELYDTWDAALNTLWKELKERLPEDEFQELLTEQRAWIKEKERAMDEAGADVAGGTMEPLVRNMEGAGMTEERVYELYELLNR